MMGLIEYGSGVLSLASVRMSHEKKKAASVRGFCLELFCLAKSESTAHLLSRVFVFIYLPAGMVLLSVELALLALGQVTVVGGHIPLLLIVDVLFLTFHVRGLSGRHSAILLAVGNAVLLILFAAVDFVDARMTGINYARPRAGCVAVLGLSSGGANHHKTTHCQD
jgi:hypothetical protein